jgi:hypothetical protein
LFGAFRRLFRGNPPHRPQVRLINIVFAVTLIELTIFLLLALLLLFSLSFPHYVCSICHLVRGDPPQHLQVRLINIVFAVALIELMIFLLLALFLR